MKSLAPLAAPRAVGVGLPALITKEYALLAKLIEIQAIVLKDNLMQLVLLTLSYVQVFCVPYVPPQP